VVGCIRKLQQTVNVTKALYRKLFLNISLFILKQFFYSFFNHSFLFILKNISSMKQTFASLFVIAAIAMVSCHKTDVAPQSSANSTSSEQSIAITTPDKTMQTKLTLRAPAGVLSRVDLSRVKFTLITDPELVADATDKIAPTLATDEGVSGYFKDASLLPSSAKPSLPENALQVELPAMPKIGSYALSVTSDDAVADVVSGFFYRSNYHRIRVTNNVAKSIIVDFYNYFNGWRYSGFSYQLSNAYAWYQHCTRTVGAEVTSPNTYNYTVRYVSLCK